ncbi:MAG: DUF3332 domain-containing protein [Candidatus Symbiothrix sp.]|jgi:hypothetical protein|nr:DUF3332 domain-containing protein [Candidatus Symbiothrix sp.]
MKRKFAAVTTTVLLSTSILFSSCIGSFGLFNKLLTWNRSINHDEWVNELAYVLLWIIPAYEVAALIDGLVLNTIEFWTGENPVETTQIQQIETKSGVYTITTNSTGHKIRKSDSEETLEFRFNAEEKSWSLATADDGLIPLFRFTGENQAEVYLADGSTMTVDLNQAGVTAFRRQMESRNSPVTAFFRYGNR